MSKRVKDGGIAAAAISCIVLTGCTSTGQPMGSAATPSPVHWELDAVSQRCLASVAVGAAAGAVIGALVDGGRGAVVGGVGGLAAGGALCAIMVALDEQDKSRLKTAQLEAAREGRAVSAEYTGNDGRKRSIRVTPRPIVKIRMPSSSGSASLGTTQEKLCRPVDPQISVEGKGTANLPVQYTCRNAQGDWVPESASNLEVASTQRPGTS